MLATAVVTCWIFFLVRYWKASKFLDRYEGMALKPLSMTLSIFGLWYLSDFQWLASAVAFGSSVFLIGGIASSMKRDRSTSELLNPPEPENGPLACISPDESMLFGRAMVKLYVLGWIPFLLLTIHHGVKWYWAVPVSLIGNVAIVWLLLGVSLGSAWFVRRQSGVKSTAE